MGCVDRIVKLVAVCSDSVEVNLRRLGVSSSICTQLRKRLGLVYRIAHGEKKPLRLVDFLDTGCEFYIVLHDEPTTIPKYDFPLNIVYEDEDVAVVDKPYGLAVIATHGHYGKSLANALASIWGDFVYRPVNRLDRDTSGLMIIAKNSLAHSILASSEIIKKYVGLCRGTLQGEGVWEFPIASSEEGMKRIVSPSGRYAKTAYRVLQNYDDCTLVEFQLFTGRTHQIRTHCAHVGHSLVCDRLYGDGKPFLCLNGKVLDRQALHSSYLCFDSPISGERVELTSKADFE